MVVDVFVLCQVVLVLFGILPSTIAGHYKNQSKYEIAVPSLRQSITRLQWCKH